MMTDTPTPANEAEKRVFEYWNKETDSGDTLMMTEGNFNAALAAARKEGFEAAREDKGPLYECLIISQAKYRDFAEFEKRRAGK